MKTIGILVGIFFLSLSSNGQCEDAKPHRHLADNDSREGHSHNDGGRHHDNDDEDHDHDDDHERHHDDDDRHHDDEDDDENHWYNRRS